MSQRFFYHSFPRSEATSGEYSKALAVLESILKNGLLLTPEKWSFRESLVDGGHGPEWGVVQKRICFTELAPTELAEHAKTFGPFALEWDVDSLRRMGATPAFYVPMHAPQGSLEGIGAAMLARLAEVSMVVSLLRQLRDIASGQNPDETIDIPVDGVGGAKMRATAGACLDIVNALTANTRSVEELEAALQWVPGLLYPIDNPARYPGALRYYSQREWKILGNMRSKRVPVTRAPTPSEKSENQVKRALSFTHRIRSSAPPSPRS